MARFYFPFSMATGETVAMLPDMVRHMQVLRLREGDVVTLFNGDGGEYLATLTTIEKKQIHAKIGEFVDQERELSYEITLAQGLPESSKMDEIIEKAIELGVSKVQPIAAQRSVVKLTPERAVKRYAHWEGIVVAASSQCGRNRLATILPLASAQNAFSKQEGGVRIIFSPRATQSLPEWAQTVPPQSVTFFIGPEGGFSPEEEAHAVNQGVLLLSLGARVLRTETAGMAAVSALNAIWDKS